jgi:hypothetical protein
VTKRRERSTKSQRQRRGAESAEMRRETDWVPLRYVEARSYLRDASKGRSASFRG